VDAPIKGVTMLKMMSMSSLSQSEFAKISSSEATFEWKLR
jgi:hypothetical protein